MTVRTNRAPEIDVPKETNRRQGESRLRLGGIIRALLATLLWSSSALIIDRISSLDHLTALEISTWRVLLVVSILTIVIAIRRPSAFRIEQRDVPQYAVAGLVGVTLSNVTWAASVQANRPAVAAALGFSAPAFIALGDRLIFGARIKRIQSAAITVNLLGCGLAAGIQDPSVLVASPAGLLIGLANGFAFAVYSLLNQWMARARAPDPLTNLFYFFLVGEIGIVAWGLAAEGVRLFMLHLNVTGWILIGCLGLGPTLGAYAFFNSSLRALRATVASAVTTLEPPIVAVFAFFILGRTIKIPQWIGIVLIVAAVLVMQLYTIRASARRK